MLRGSSLVCPSSSAVVGNPNNSAAASSHTAESVMNTTQRPEARSMNFGFWVGEAVIVRVGRREGAERVGLRVG